MLRYIIQKQWKHLEIFFCKELHNDFSRPGMCRASNKTILRIDPLQLILTEIAMQTNDLLVGSGGPTTQSCRQNSHF